MAGASFAIVERRILDRWTSVVHGIARLVDSANFHDDDVLSFLGNPVPNYRTAAQLDEVLRIKINQCLDCTDITLYNCCLPTVLPRLRYLR